MAAQLRRRLVDADDIGPHGPAGGAPRHDEVAIAGPGALKAATHQAPGGAAAGRPDAPAGREAVRQTPGTLGPGRGDPGAPRRARHFGHRRRALLGFLVVPVHTRCSSLQGPPQCGRERLGVARLFVATAVDEEPGRAAHAALGAAPEVFTDPRRVDVGDELAPHPLRVEPQLAGVPHQILVRERRLPLVQEIVHLPELALRGRRLRDLRGVLGVRVLLTQRKMPEHELNLASDLPQHLLQIRVGAAAKRALEIAVLHERDGSLHRSQGVVARPDGRSQQGHGVVSVRRKRVARAHGTPSASRGVSRCRMAPRWYAACAIAPIATPSASSSHTACVSTATSSVSYSRRSRAWRSAQAASSTLDTVQLRLRSRDVCWPRRPRVESARLELRWWMWPAMVVWPGPPAWEAAAALTPPIVPKTPVPGDVSVK